MIFVKRWWVDLDGKYEVEEVKVELLRKGVEKRERRVEVEDVLQSREAEQEAILSHE
jgi:hypothetical protein